MAVTLVVGNSSTDIRASLFTARLHDGHRDREPVHRSRQRIYFSAIVEIALVLLVVARVVNGIARGARAIAWRRGPQGAVI